MCHLCITLYFIHFSIWQVGVPVYKEGTEVKPAQIAKNGLEEAKKKNIDVVVVDTAGRLQVCLNSTFLFFLSDGYILGGQLKMTYANEFCFKH